MKKVVILGEAVMAWYLPRHWRSARAAQGRKSGNWSDFWTTLVVPKVRSRVFVCLGYSIPGPPCLEMFFLLRPYRRLETCRAARLELRVWAYRRSGGPR